MCGPQPPLDDGAPTLSGVPDVPGELAGAPDWVADAPNDDAEARFLAFLSSYRDEAGAVAHNERVTRRRLAFSTDTGKCLRHRGGLQL